MEENRENMVRVNQARFNDQCRHHTIHFVYFHHLQYFISLPSLLWPIRRTDKDFKRKGRDKERTFIVIKIDNKLLWNIKQTHTFYFFLSKIIMLIIIVHIIESSIDGTHMNMKTILKYILYEDKTVFWPQLLHCSNLEKANSVFFLQNEILRGRRRSGSS